MIKLAFIYMYMRVHTVFRKQINIRNLFVEMFRLLLITDSARKSIKIESLCINIHLIVKVNYYMDS